MKIKAVLFDLDGTLLPMDLDKFVEAYFVSLAKRMYAHGYTDTAKFLAAIQTGTRCMVKNDGRETNESVFWESFLSVYGKDGRLDEPLFYDFYINEFQSLRTVCGFDPRAAGAVAQIKEMGLRVALATNPLFPPVATESRVRWAGLSPSDFELYTTYENSRYAKPSLGYYRDIADSLGLCCEECLMVGNDVDEDMAARGAGMPVFLLTDCLINRRGADIVQYPSGSFAELVEYVGELNKPSGLG